LQLPLTLPVLFCPTQTLLPLQQNQRPYSLLLLLNYFFSKFPGKIPCQAPNHQKIAQPTHNKDDLLFPKLAR